MFSTPAVLPNQSLVGQTLEVLYLFNNSSPGNWIVNMAMCGSLPLRPPSHVDRPIGYRPDRALGLRLAEAEVCAKLKTDANQLDNPTRSKANHRA